LFDYCRLCGKLAAWLMLGLGVTVWHALIRILTNGRMCSPRKFKFLQYIDSHFRNLSLFIVYAMPLTST